MHLQHIRVSLECLHMPTTGTQQHPPAMPVLQLLTGNRTAAKNVLGPSYQAVPGKRPTHPAGTHRTTNAVFFSTTAQSSIHAPYWFRCQHMQRTATVRWHDLHCQPGGHKQPPQLLDWLLHNMCTSQLQVHATEYSSRQPLCINHQQQHNTTASQ